MPLRVGLLVIACVVLQVSGVGSLRVLGGSVDLIPLLVGAIALLAGSSAGALSGFATGLVLDLALGRHLGASALALSVVGYAIGRYREEHDPAHGLMAVPVAAAATAGYAVMMAGVSFLLGVEASVSPLVLREALVTLLLNGLLAVPAFALVERVLRPVLIADPLARSRRRPTSQPGPLSVRGVRTPG